MKRHLPILSFLAAITFMAGMFAPISSSAQSQTDKASSHRQKTKNGWRNAAIGSGAVGVYGLLKGDKTLGILGTAGAIYSGQRYEHDRRGQRRIDNGRHNSSHSSFIYRNGKRYRRTVSWHNGKQHTTVARA